MGTGFRTLTGQIFDTTTLVAHPLKREHRKKGFRDFVLAALVEHSVRRARAPTRLARRRSKRGDAGEQSQ
jgi:hypothetical protein